jgi:hypothetical protein
MRDVLVPEIILDQPGICAPVSERISLDELVQIRALLTPCPLTELEFQIRGYPCRELSGHTCGDGVEEM